MGQPIKTTVSGKASSNYIDIGTGGIGSDIDTGGTIVHIQELEVRIQELEVHVQKQELEVQVQKIGTGGKSSDTGTGGAS